MHRNTRSSAYFDAPCFPLAGGRGVCHYGRVEVETRHNEELSRWEVLADGELAGWVDYRLAGDNVIIAHTEVLPAYERKGLAAKVTEATFEWVAGEGRTIVPACAYAIAHLHRHPEWVDHVAAPLQARFRN